METKVIMAKLTFKHPSADPDLPADEHSFYGNDARDKALLRAKDYTGYIRTIEIVEKVN